MARFVYRVKLTEPDGRIRERDIVACDKWNAIALMLKMWEWTFGEVEIHAEALGEVLE